MFRNHSPGPRPGPGDGCENTRHTSSLTRLRGLGPAARSRLLAALLPIQTTLCGVVTAGQRESTACCGILAARRFLRDVAARALRLTTRELQNATIRLFPTTEAPAGDGQSGSSKHNGNQ